MRFARFAAAAALFVGAVNEPARAADPPRDSLHLGTGEVGEHTDPRGMSALDPDRKRTPSGLLYPFPPARPLPNELGSGWLARGAFSFGGQLVGGDEDETRFETYRRVKDGVLLDLFHLELARPESGDYAFLRGGSVGRDDQFYDFDAGRAGWLRVRGSWTGVPHRYASDATSLYDDIGSDVLRLPTGVVPSATDPADVAVALGARDERRLEVLRERGQLGAKLRLLPSLALVASYGLEDRHGAIPHGVGFAFPELTDFGGATLEVPSPVDDRTHAVRTALEWSGARAQANVSYAGSFYRNRDESLTLEQPFVNLGATALREARLALAPDNDRHDLRAEFAALLPLRARLSGTFGWSQSKQNADLLPPTISTETIGTLDLNLWNTRSALSRESARAQVNNRLVDVDLHLNPWRPLRLRAGFRYADQETDTRYVASNPLTGELGYIAEDGGHGATLSDDYAGVYRPAVPGSSWRYRTIPFGQERRSYELGATYTAPFRSALDLRVEQDDVERDVSERPKTRERRSTVSLSSRGLPFATTRVSYQWKTRDGGTLDYRAYAPYSTESVPGFLPAFPDGEPPHNLDELVRPSLADLRGQRWNARVNFALGERSDLALSGRLRSDDYGSEFGLQADRSRDLEAEWTVQASPELSGHLFLSLERHARSMANIRGFASSSDGSAGGANFPFDNEWGVDTRGSTVGWGGGLSVRPHARLELRTNYLFLVTRERQELAFTTPSALASPGPVNPNPDEMPTLRSRDHAVETSLRIALLERVAVRIFHRYERSAVDDFHQNALPTLVGRRLYFGHEDGDFSATFYGVAVEVGF